MLIKWKSDFWTDTTRHVGRTGERNARLIRAKSDREAPETLSSSAQFASLPAEAGCETC